MLPRSRKPHACHKVGERRGPWEQVILQEQIHPCTFLFAIATDISAATNPWYGRNCRGNCTFWRRHMAPCGESTALRRQGHLSIAAVVGSLKTITNDSGIMCRAQLYLYIHQLKNNGSSSNVPNHRTRTLHKWSCRSHSCRLASHFQGCSS